MSYDQLTASVSTYLGALPGNASINIDGVLAFLQEFSGGDATALRTLKIERLQSVSRSQNLGLPEGVCSAIVLNLLRPKISGGSSLPQRRMFRTDYQQLTTANLVAEFAKDPFNPRALAAVEMRARAKGAACVVFENGTDVVDIDGTTQLVEAQLHKRPVSSLFNGQPVFHVGQRPNEMVGIDPLRMKELTLDGKDQTYGLKWGTIAEETRSFLIYLVREGHLTIKGLDRQDAATIYNRAKSGDLESLAAYYAGEEVLVTFRNLQAANMAPQVTVLRSSLHGDNLTSGLRRAVSGA